MRISLQAIGCAAAAALMLAPPARAAVVDSFDGNQFNTAYTFTSHTTGGVEDTSLGAVGASSESPPAESFDATAGSGVLRLQAHDSSLFPEEWGITDVLATPAAGLGADTRVAALVSGGGGNGDNGLFARHGVAGRYQLSLDFFDGEVELVRRTSTGAATDLHLTGLPNDSFNAAEDYFLELLVSGAPGTGVELEAAVYTDAAKTTELLRFTYTDASAGALDAGHAGVFAGFNNEAFEMLLGEIHPSTEATDAVGTFDLVSVTVPEPSGVAVLALAAAGVLARRRSRRA